MSSPTPNARLVHVEIDPQRPSRSCRDHGRAFAGAFCPAGARPPSPQTRGWSTGGSVPPRAAGAARGPLPAVSNCIQLTLPSDHGSLRCPTLPEISSSGTLCQKLAMLTLGGASNFLLRGGKERRPGQLPTSSGEANPASGCKRIRRVIQSQGQQVYPSVWEVLDLCWHMEN